MTPSTSGNLQIPLKFSFERELIDSRTTQEKDNGELSQLNKLSHINKLNDSKKLMDKIDKFSKSNTNREYDKDLVNVNVNHPDLLLEVNQKINNIRFKMRSQSETRFRENNNLPQELHTTDSLTDQPIYQSKLLLISDNKNDKNITFQKMRSNEFSLLIERADGFKGLNDSILEDFDFFLCIPKASHSRINQEPQKMARFNPQVHRESLFKSVNSEKNLSHRLKSPSFQDQKLQRM